MSGQVGAYIGCAVFALVTLALAYFGYDRYRNDRNNPLWLFTSIAGLLASVGFVALITFSLVFLRD